MGTDCTIMSFCLYGNMKKCQFLAIWCRWISLTFHG